MCMSCGKKSSPIKTRGTVTTAKSAKRIVYNAFGSPKIKKSVSFSSRNR